MTAPKYLQWLGDAATALRILSVHRNGLSVSELADLLDVSQLQVREMLAAYSSGASLALDAALDDNDSGLLFLDSQLPTPSALTGDELTQWLDDHSVPPEIAEWVALDVTAMPGPFAVMLSVDEVVQLLAAADSLFATEPDNEALRQGIAALRLQWLPEQSLAVQFFTQSEVLPTLREGIRERRKVSFVYSREWEPGVMPRIVEPYALKRTYLGYELDAGPVRDDGRIRTFLLRNMRDVELLDETFEMPDDVAELIDVNRETMSARVIVPKSAMRSYEGLVATLQVVTEDADGDGDRELQLTIQQPFHHRLALFLLRAGPEAILLEPESMSDVAADLATELLAHHGLD